MHLPRVIFGILGAWPPCPLNPPVYQIPVFRVHVGIISLWAFDAKVDDLERSLLDHRGINDNGTLIIFVRLCNMLLMPFQCLSIVANVNDSDRPFSFPAASSVVLACLLNLPPRAVSSVVTSSLVVKIDDVGVRVTYGCAAWRLTTEPSNNYARLTTRLRVKQP